MCAGGRLVRGELAAARRKPDEARRAYEDAIDCFEEGSAPYDACRARVELGRVLLGMGRGERARAEALAAHDLFARLGAGRDLVRAREVLRGEPLADDGGRFGGLTPRELEVLRLVARGRSDAEIAEELVVSPHTVHRHVANIRTKLRQPSRSAAVAYAAREGLLEPA